jgi:CRP-like cAMP-binding protein
LNSSAFHKLTATAAGITQLSKEDMDRFCAAASPMEWKKGQLLLKEGDLCKRIFFVDNGYLRTYHTQDGLEINTGLHFEGSFVTNLKSLLKGTPSTSFIAAAEPALVYVFTKEKMMELYAQSPPILDFGKKLLEKLAMQQEEHLELFKLYSAEQRFRHIEQHQPEMLQRVPLSWLASYLGVARETLSRFRRKL